LSGVFFTLGLKYEQLIRSSALEWSAADGGLSVVFFTLRLTTHRWCVILQ
jgi:hypothetical protein